MIIRRMRASFGRLEDRELSLRPGLNVISGSNETGKSTWLAFLLAMFYGVDTGERSRADRLPDKLRYQPWSGKPMAGTLELIDGERSITLERSSRTGPMGDFRAWDSASGTALETLTGKSCGRELLGVEAAVYTRSGFLRQQNLAVSPDAQLEKRLSGLVTAGSEDYAYTELDEKLKKLQNALRYNRTGALPQAEDRRVSLQSRLAGIGEKQRELAALEAELQALRQQREQVQENLAGLDALDQLARQGQVSNAEIALAAAASDRANWEDICARLPEAETLEPLEAQVKQLQSDLQKAALTEEPPASPPAPDPIFGYMDAQQAQNKALADAETVREAAQAAKPPRKYRALLWLLLALPGVALVAWSTLLLKQWTMLLGLGMSFSGIGLWLWRYYTLSRREDGCRARQEEAQTILEAYGTDSEAGIMEQARRYAQSLAQPREPGPRQLLAQQRDLLLDRLKAVLPGCDTLEQAETRFREAAQSRQALVRARALEQERAEQLDRLRAALGTPVERDRALERFAVYDRETETNRLRELDAALETAAARTAMLEGAIGQMGDPLVLSGDLERLERDICRMEERYAALQLARTTLAQADETLRARFAPLLCQRTGELFERLTGGAYDRVQLDRSMKVTVRPKGSAVFRSLSYLSGGTVDQLYLALRLAICELLIPKAPIVLDDALVFFDDERAALALETLREMSKTRQILVFTSQSREKRILDELASRP